MAAVGYLVVLLAALALTSGLTPAARHLAKKFALLDAPSGRKTQASAVPILGGIAIALGFSVVLIAAALFLPSLEAQRQLAAAVGLAMAVLLLGLADDIRGLNPWLRLAVEAVIGAGTWAAGLGVSLAGMGAVNLMLTVLWVVALTNAFNLLDNMDGLSSGVAAIAALWFLIIAGVNGQYLVALMAATVAGCALGFLRYNLPPARIYMGDAGALFLGFCLAVIGMKLRFAGPTRVTFFVPILVLGVALLDTTLVTVTRLTAGRSPFEGGRDHVSHRLVQLGASPRNAVTGLWGLGTIFGWTALVMSRVDTGTAFALMGLVFTLCTAAGVLLTLVPTRNHTPAPAAAAPPAAIERIAT